MTDVALIGAGSGQEDLVEQRIPHVDADTIRQQLETIRDAMAPVMTSGAAGLSLESVALELGITGSGEVGFIVAKGTVELAATITLTFARPGK